MFAFPGVLRIWRWNYRLETKVVQTERQFKSKIANDSLVGSEVFGEHNQTWRSVKLPRTGKIIVTITVEQLWNVAGKYNLDSVRHSSRVYQLCNWFQVFSKKRKVFVCDKRRGLWHLAGNPNFLVQIFEKVIWEMPERGRVFLLPETYKISEVYFARFQADAFGAQHFLVVVWN